MKKLLAISLMLVLCIGMLVGCGNTGLNAAVDNLKQLHKDIPTLTPSDYEVVGKLTINGAEYTVDWSVNVTEGVTIVKAEDGTITVDVNEYAESDIAYTLTAKVTAADGKSETLTFNHTVPTFKELTWAEYMAKEDDEAVIVKGVLTAIIKGSSKTHLNFQDADGGYYAYNIKELPEGLAVGMTVRVTGLRDTYGGGAQIAAGCTVEILDTNITEVEPLDITEAVLAADGEKDEDLLKYNGMLVTVKGVTMMGQDLSDTTYFRYKLGNVNTYIRISSSECLLDKDQQNTFKDNVEEYFGYNATATGIVSVYNNAFYMVPVDENAYSDFVIQERDNAGQVAFEKMILSTTYTYTYTASETTELSLKGRLYKGVAITWALKEASDYAIVNGDELNVILPPEKTKVILVATLTAGDATDTKEFEITLNAAPTAIPERVDAPLSGAENLYKIYLYQANKKQNLFPTGVMDGFYGEMVSNPEEGIEVYLVPVEGKEGEFELIYPIGKTATGRLSVYLAENGYINFTFDSRKNYTNTFKYDAEKGMIYTELKDKDGKDVTYFLGTRGNYTTLGAYDLTKLDSTYHLLRFATMKDMASVPDTEKIETTKDELSIPSKVIGNAAITLPQVGKTFSTVTVDWTVEGEGASIANGVLTIAEPEDVATITLTAVITAGETTETVTYTIEAKVYKMTPAEIVDAAYDLAKDASLGNFTLTGTVIRIDTPYNSQYGNITVTIVVAGKYDKTIQCYRMKGDDAGNIAVGDIITVTGEIKKYGDNVQFNQNAVMSERKTAADIYDAASALEHQGKLDGIFTLTGEITSVDTPYSEQHGNVTVTIKIGDKYFKCYRIKGEGADVIKVGDTITVSGEIQKYSSSIQVANGQINSYPKTMTLDEIFAAAAELADNAVLDGEFTMTGEITSIDTAYSEQHKNITVTLKITDDYSIQCYRLAGEAGADLEVGDTITVTGQVSKYGTKIQFKNATFVVAE